MGYFGRLRMLLGSWLASMPGRCAAGFRPKTCIDGSRRRAALQRFPQRIPIIGPSCKRLARRARRTVANASDGQSSKTAA